MHWHLSFELKLQKNTGDFCLLEDINTNLNVYTLKVQALYFPAMIELNQFSIQLSVFRKFKSTLTKLRPQYIDFFLSLRLLYIMVVLTLLINKKYFNKNIFMFHIMDEIFKLLSKKFWYSFNYLLADGREFTTLQLEL